MKARIRLDTLQDIRKFVDITSKLDGKIVITDNNGLCVNGRSMLGCMYSLEFDELWCESDKDIYASIRQFLYD